MTFIILNNYNSIINITESNALEMSTKTVIGIPLIPTKFMNKMPLGSTNVSGYHAQLEKEITKPNNAELRELTGMKNGII